MKTRKDFFTRNPVWVEYTRTLKDVAIAMRDHNVGCVVIVDELVPVGIITDRDLAIALGCMGLDTSSSVEKVMSCPVTTMKVRDGVLKATELIEEAVTRRLPIVDEMGRLVGLVTVDDLMLLLTEELANLAEGIRPEVAALS